MSDGLTWIDTDGVEHDLRSFADGAEILDRGVRGRFMPPVKIIEAETPGQPGSRRREVRHLARDIAVPLYVEGESASALRGTVRDWLRRFDAVLGNGRLRATPPIGGQREIACCYEDGFEGDEGTNGAGLHWQTATLLFHAFDPYWYDVSPIVVSWTLGATPATFFPFFPLRLTSSEVFADAVVSNGGDVEAWPVWTITGPGSSIVLRNLTTGKLLNLSTVLTAGETATIDTRPGAKTVVKNDGSNLFPDLLSDSSLWPLVQDSNSVRVEMASATST